MRQEWSRFSPEELERRRRASIEAFNEREQESFLARYQRHCDRIYWSRGKCCAGCDHWSSVGGNSGQCTAAGILSGVEVMRSITGGGFCSYIPEPGFPFTKAHFYCGKFRDDFDWSTLDQEYLASIGAIRNGALRPKPDTVATDAALSTRMNKGEG